MKTIIFDLKNTLVDEDGQLKQGAEKVIVSASEAARSILYTMNEPWTYETLSANPDVWQRFSQLLVVNKKQLDDLRPFFGDDVMVVGDSVVEELEFARELGYRSLQVQGPLPVNLILNFLKDLS